MQTPLSDQPSRTTTFWGSSSAGRARQSHCRGQGFDPPLLHHHFLFRGALWDRSKPSLLFSTSSRPYESGDIPLGEASGRPGANEVSGRRRSPSAPLFSVDEEIAPVPHGSMTEPVMGSKDATSEAGAIKAPAECRKRGLSASAPLFLLMENSRDRRGPAFRSWMALWREPRRSLKLTQG